MSTNFLFAIFQGVIFLINAVLLIQAQNQSGFISIDCGISDVSNYTDETTGISYFSDANFTETGENSEITAAYKLQTDEKQFWNVRSFPQGTRNCYTLKPFTGKGERYLIRARFMYGNYDNKGLVPKFDLYIGVDLWDTVVLEEARIIENKEIIHVPKLDYIHVCLVNTGFGVPFISVLELRPLNNETYVSQSETEALKLYQRFDFASTTDQIMRYKDDVYDRLWSPFQAEIWKPINASLEDENSISRNLYASPLAVLSTAYTRNSSIGYMGVIWKKLNSSSKYYFYMHFAELEKLGKNQTREFNIYINGDLWYGPLVPEYFSETTIYSASGHTTDSEGKIVVWINKTENSTLPPLINAMEIYDIKELSQQETNLTDVDAILNIKSVYEVKRNWQGDPCAPKAYSWNGLNCSYDANNLPRIISLDLSLSGLKGEISPYIAELTMLEYLDLSNNSLTGTLPEFLAQLSFLRVLNLKGNNLKGPLPAALLGRLNNGLSISADASVIGRKVSSPTSESSSSPGYCWFKKNKFVVPMFSLVGGFLLHFVL